MTNFELTIGGFENLWELLSAGVYFENVVDALMNRCDFWNYEIITAELNPIEGAWLIKARVAFPAHIREEVEKHTREKGAEIFQLS
jgi:hypothetical protein